MLQTYQTTLINIHSFPGGVLLLKFTIEGSQEIVFSPGQYVVLTIPHKDAFVKRLYSIASSSSINQSFELLVKCISGGIASRYLCGLTIGQKVEFQGPAGVFCLSNTPLSKVFLATGTGLAPVRSFLLSHEKHTEHYYLFWGLPLFKDVYLFDELKSRAQKDPLFHIKICLSKEDSLDFIDKNDRVYFSLGHINDAARGLATTQPQNSLEYYSCGRREMVESMRGFLESQNIDKKLIFFERY